MATPAKKGKLKILRDYKKYVTTKLGAFIKGLKLHGDPDCTDPPSDNDANKVLADDMLDTNIQRVTNPSKNLTAVEKKQKNAVWDALDADANYVETIANAVAKSAGDVNAGISVITRIGFLVAGKGIPKHNVGVVDFGVGWFHAHEEKIKSGTEMHVWCLGLTTAKGTPPSNSAVFATCEADCIFNNLTSGSILAYCHASVVPVSHVAQSGTQASPQSLSAKSASAIPMSKSKHPVIDINNKNYYKFGDWRYVVIL